MFLLSPQAQIDQKLALTPAAPDSPDHNDQNGASWAALLSWDAATRRRLFARVSLTPR